MLGISHNNTPGQDVLGHVFTFTRTAWRAQHLTGERAEDGRNTAQYYEPTPTRPLLYLLSSRVMGKLNWQVRDRVRR
jgi:hypothetical protein